MDASAALNAASQASPAGNGSGSSLASDPLKRLEAELEATGEPPGSADGAQPDGAKPDGAQLYEEAQRLLEEAWSIFTECQVMRDGLLVACQEIERTMDTIQHRLGGAPAATELNGNGHLANGRASAPSSTGPNSNDTGHSSNGDPHGANVADPGSNGNGHSSNGSSPH
jgi:hypothetical protein